LLTKNLNEDEIIEIIKEQNPEGGNKMLTLLAEKIEKRGIEKGIEKGKIEGEIKGKLEGKQNILINQMSKKFGLTSDETVIIKTCKDITKLDQALEDILFFDNKTDVLKNLN